MTKRDDLRVGKALQGIDFPASRQQLLDYAAERGVDVKSMTALRSLPFGQYASLADVEGAVPQEPEGAEASGGLDR